MIEILYFDGCPNHEGLDEHLRALLTAAGVNAPITSRRIESELQAEQERFLGSPTIRVNGVDVDPSASGRSAYGLTCRVYATADGLRGTPPDSWILDALRQHA
ncbi:thioredoxin family protein [Micromonospora craterilacus]|uniref:Thioredoxin family protein n=1 Tax=Micromonospora craterilacus TaxID=1655439 RepID=A0A2W2EIP1_9ACTN|nr:thioredoxin family protein [Micromonospora craterilacus]PZG12088.1 thioredoxin family protein [Micromonospora craterilacus]